MQIFIDGGKMLIVYWKTVLVFYSTILGFGYFLVSHFPETFKEKKWLIFPTSLGAGTILVTLLSFVLFLLNLLWQGIAPYGAYIIFFGGIGLLLFYLRQKEVLVSTIYGSSILLFILVIRLAFISELVLPPYSDSPTHYLIVLNLLTPSARPDTLYSFETIFQHYYHFGFHTLTAWVSLISGETSPLLLAILGQFFLTILPFSVFALLGVLTRNKSGAWIAGILAGFGWLMPAFGVNWGKYPSIAGLSVLPIALLHLCISKEFKHRILSVFVNALLITGVVLLHSRMSILLGLSILAYIVTNNLENRFKKASYGLLLIASFLLLSFFYWGWLRSDITGYYRSDWLLLLATMIVIPAAWLVFPNITLTVLFVLAGIGLLNTIQSPTLLKTYSFQVLDRPFVQLCLFLPLSALAGAGLAALQTRMSEKILLSKLPILLFLCLLPAQTMDLHYFYPDRCCSYVTTDDNLAYKWLEQNVSSNGTVFIAGLQTSTRILETDAGIWIYALTGIKTKKRSFNSNLNDPDFLLDMCQGGDEVYLYAGGRKMSFKQNKIHKDIENYKVVFSSDNSEVVQAIACQK